MHLRGKGKPVDVSFGSGRLARECNSGALRRARWGGQWRSVGRRLQQIAAAPSVADLALLPRARLSNGRGPGTYEIEFGEGILVNLVAVDAAGHPITGDTERAVAVEIQI